MKHLRHLFAFTLAILLCIALSAAHAASEYTQVDKTPRIAKSAKLRDSSDPCEIRKAPNKDGSIVRLAEKDTVLYLTGAVKNTAGNTWYQTDDGYFVYNQDVTIAVADASHTEKAITAIGVSKNADCWLKELPYEAAKDQGKSVAKGNTVVIAAKVTNSYGNTWYKTADGRFIYSGDLDVHEYTVLFSITAEFTSTQKCSSRKGPYEAAAAASSIAKNAKVHVTQFVVNKYGNIWAQLTDGSFLCFYDQDAKETKLTFVGSNMAVSDVRKPTGYMNLGDSFNLSGIIKTQAPVYSITAQVINSATSADALSPVTVKPNDAKLREFDINKSINGTNINKSLTFGKLPTGVFQYRIGVQFGFEYKGNVLLLGTAAAVIESDFSVDTFANDPYPPKGSTMLEIARSQIGYQGSNTADNLTGANVTTKGKYTKYASTDGKPHEWCAAFVIWCARQAGVPNINWTLFATPGITANSQKKDAVVFFDLTPHQKAQKENHAYFENGIYVRDRASFTPDPGDLIFFLWEASRSSHSFSHVGIVSDVRNGRVYYIDGNGTNLTVTERNRLLTDPLIVCYCKVEGAYTNVPSPDRVTRMDAYAGQTITIPVGVDYAIGMKDATLRIDLGDAPVTLVSITAAQGCANEVTLPETLDKPITLHNNSGIAAETVAYVTIRVNGSITPGEYTITVTGTGSAAAVTGTTVLTMSGRRIPGDVNGSGVVNMDDVVRLQQYLATGAVIINPANSDVNGDDRINMNDVLLLMQFQAGWNVTLR